MIDGLLTAGKCGGQSAGAYPTLFTAAVPARTSCRQLNYRIRYLWSLSLLCVAENTVISATRQNNDSYSSNHLFLKTAVRITIIAVIVFICLSKDQLFVYQSAVVVALIYLLLTSADCSFINQYLCYKSPARIFTYGISC